MIRIDTDKLPRPSFFDSGDMMVTKIESLEFGFDVHCKKDGTEYILFEYELGNGISIGKPARILFRTEGYDTKKAPNIGLDFFK